MRGRVMGLVQTVVRREPDPRASARALPRDALGLACAVPHDCRPCALVGGVAIVCRLEPLTAHLEGANARSEARSSTWFARRRGLATSRASPRRCSSRPAASCSCRSGARSSCRTSASRSRSSRAIYMVDGASSIFAGPLHRAPSDSFGKFRTFASARRSPSSTVLWYTGLPSGLARARHRAERAALRRDLRAHGLVVGADVGAPRAAGSRRVHGDQLVVQQLSGGFAAWIAGLIVHQATPTLALDGYPTLGSSWSSRWWFRAGAHVQRRPPGSRSAATAAPPAPAP